MERNYKRSQDRLSLLPDTILVEILSRLPLKSAVITDILSKRWRHLWTQITSVVVSDCIINFKYDGFFTSLHNSILHLASPSIDTFVLDFQAFKQPFVCNFLLFILWPCLICQRNNPRDLSVSLPTGHSCHNYQVHWPRCIFRTRSLISIQLRSIFTYYKTDEIELPNLKKLSLCVAPSQCGWLTKLVESCPLLEDLSFKFMFNSNCSAVDRLKCTGLNLKRLSINLAGLQNEPCKVVVNAPKLEHLDASAAQSTNTTLCIGHEPFSLHEARLDVRAFTTFLSSRAVKTFSTFPSLSRLTLNFDFLCKFEAVMSFLELRPVLDVLTFGFKATTMLDDTDWLNIPSIRTLERIKKIEVLVCHNDFELEEHFAEVIGYLLKHALVLERFCFSVLAPHLSEMGDANLVTQN